MADSNVVASLQALGNMKITDKTVLLDVIDAYRCLRNFCSTGLSGQLYVAEHQEVLNNTKDLIKYLLFSRSNDLCLLVSLQFIANFLVENKKNQVFIWSNFYNLLKKCLHYNESKIIHCATMIFYNIFLDNDHILQDIDEPLDDIIALTQNEMTSEYSVFILELFICRTNYIKNKYKFLKVEDRLILLSVVESIQSNQDGRKFPDSMIIFLSQYFVERARYILTLTNSELEEMQAREVAQVLNIINSIASSDDEYLKEIQKVEELLVTAIGMLSTVHSLSKEKGNQFSMLLKLAELEAQPTQEIEGRPCFGFKAALVRLVGNLCWQHKGHQDTAREMNAIPLILDCSNIDARNPLIIQWAVLAMRNLCEGNLENQRVVACVDRNGRVDPSRLADLGVMLNGAKK